MFLKMFVVFLMGSVLVQTLSAHVINLHGRNQNKAELCQHEPDGTLINDPASCSSYFLCFSGVDISLKCPDSFQFNELLSFCDTESNVQCEEQVETTPNSICVGEEHLSFIDNAESCAAYYLCFNDVAIEVNCPPPLHFNPDIHECDFPSQCVDEVEIVPPEPSEVCDDIPNGAYVNNQASCSAYYVCLNGVPLTRNCPEGLFFDEHISECEASDKVECVDPLQVCIDKENFTNINNPDACSSYYVCMNEYAVPANCPAPLYFNSLISECDFPQNVACEEEPEPNLACVDYPNGHFVNDESSCAAYYICIHGQPVSATCPDLLHFNAETDECVPEGETSCDIGSSVCHDKANGTVIDDPSSCPAYFFCLDTVALNLFCPNPLYFNPDIGHCDFQENVQCGHIPQDKHCEHAENYDFVRNPTSCAHFFQCIDGAAFPGMCPYPWLFNAETSECATPDSVDCENTTEETATGTDDGNTIEVTSEFPTETTENLTETTTDNISEMTTDDSTTLTTKDDNTESTICCETTTDGEIQPTTTDSITTPNTTESIETTATTPTHSLPSTTTVATTYARN